jgi:hypothetical protein
VRVTFKSIPGVSDVQVSLSKGEADVTFAPGNTVRYEQLLLAIEKNGFAVKGADLVADGTIAGSGSDLEFQISGSGDRLRLAPESSAAASIVQFSGKNVEVSGSVPEVAKGKNVDVIHYTTVTPK